jgi:lipid A 3-O-deacylase
LRFVWGMLLALCAVWFGAPVVEAQDFDDPPFLSVGGGYFDPYRRRDTAVEFKFEYRHDRRFLWVFKPFFGASVNTDEAFHLFGGVLIDIYLGDRIVITPSFAPGYYDSGNGLQLGHHVEFRSALEIAYRFDNRVRLGIGYSHVSNAHLSNQNPGSETAFIMLSMPLYGLAR